MKKFKVLLVLILLGKISIAQENTEIKWWNPDVNEFPVIAGQAWPEEVESIYHRLPARAQNKVRKDVWHLSKQSAGLSIRFWTNADNIEVRYKLKGNIAMPHMPATGVSGLDLYGKSYHGDWLRFWGTYAFEKISSYNFEINDESDFYKKNGREYQLFLPLYNEVDSLEIGVSKDSFFEVLPATKEKPIVAYGTSICQGACASRPGMAWTNILERRLERPVINLGFSGNGRLEPELINLMTEIDAKLYILDCLPNLVSEKYDVYELTVNAVKKLREKRRNVPIILTAHIGYANAVSNKKRKSQYVKINKELEKAFMTLKSAGFSKLFLLQKEDIGFSFDSYVDAIHPNDLGMQQYANAYERLIREVLKEASGAISTTIPVRQSRDIAVYNWEERHQEILELNKVNPPKICLFGNSIVHFWGGEPKAPIVRGQESWDNIMKPIGVRNFGFGFDRIENVLWRVQHGELDGFEAEKIVLMLGTNNLGVNNKDEIVKGIENLIKAIRIRQPRSKILLMGLLPRKGKEDLIKSLNIRLSQLSDLENIRFEDIGKLLLLENGQLDNSMFLDGLHPNGKGYDTIANTLQQFLIRN